MIRRHRRIIGIVTLVWLVGSISGAGLSWYISQRQIQSQTSEIRASLNPFVCLFRSFITPARARSAQTVDDKTQTESVRQRAANSVKTDDRILRSLITVPSSFDCSQFT